MIGCRTDRSTYLGFCLFSNRSRSAVSEEERSEWRPDSNYQGERCSDIGVLRVRIPNCFEFLTFLEYASQNILCLVFIAAPELLQQPIFNGFHQSWDFFYREFSRTAFSVWNQRSCGEDIRKQYCRSFVLEFPTCLREKLSISRWQDVWRTDWTWSFFIIKNWNFWKEKHLLLLVVIRPIQKNKSQVNATERQ